MYPISHFLTQHFTHIIHIIGNCPFLPDKIYIIDYNRNTKSYLSFHQQKRWLKQHNFSHLWQNQEPSHGCIGGARNFARILLLWNSLRRHGLKLGGGTRELDPSSQNTEKTIYVCLSTYLFICVSIWCANIQMGLLCVCVCKYSTWVWIYITADVHVWPSVACPVWSIKRSLSEAGNIPSIGPL